MVDQAIVDLHVTRRVMQIYPASHDQVKKSLVRFFKHLSAVLAIEPNIALTVLKEGLSANDRALGTSTAVFADLASVLKHHQIAAVTFSRGLEPKEVVGFLRLITSDREKLDAAGGISAILDKRPLPHIRIQTIDYSRLQLTEESEIQRSSRRDGEGSIWQDFVANLLSDENDQNQGIRAAGIELDPKEMADMLNRQILNPVSAIARYGQVLAKDAGSGSELLQISDGLSLFHQMIKELNPELQSQFLSATFDRCAHSEDISNAAQLIDGLGAELIVRMLRQASSAGKQISPSLIAFISKIGDLNAPSGTPGTGSAPPEDTEGLTSQKIESLLAHEQYDTYVDSDYDKMLNSLAGAARNPDLNSGTKVLGHELAADLTAAAINAHVGRAMSRLMTTSPDLTGYRDWARQVAYLLDELLETQAFGYLIELMAFVRAEHEGDDRQRSEIAGLLLDRFSDPQFVSKAIENVQKTGKELSPETLGFLMELGESVVLEIFDGMDPSHTLHSEGVPAQILRNLSSLTAKEALARLNDPRPEYVCRMLRIVRKMGDSESARQVQSLLDHGDRKIRMEALATLLEFDNNWGLIRLRELLQRPMEAEFEPALRLAGEYRVQAVVPQLISYLQRRGDWELREAALRALGRIGDCRAIPALTKLAHHRWSISKKQVEHLKRALYETLDGYPFGEIKHLLHFGLKQKDAAIQSACQKLLREGSK